MIGYAALLVLAWILSEQRRAIPWRTVLGGVALQWALAVVLLRVPAARAGVQALTAGADALQRATDQGTGFLFGYLAGGTLPFAETAPGASFILAFKLLPLVLVISALGAVLFHWGVMQRVVGLFAAGLRRTLGVDGPLAVAAAVHVFVGMTEAPLLIRAYLGRMQRGELFAVMTCGMAGVAGTVMVIYGIVLDRVLPDAFGAIITASVISTPAALAVAALMVPWATDIDTRGTAVAAPVDAYRAGSTLEALVRGTADGVAPLVGIATALIVAVSLVALINMALGGLPGTPTLQGLLAWPLRPLVWAIGVPWADAGPAALLLSTKTVLNEFVAYVQLAAMGDSLAPQTRLVMTYALCGFANFGSVGILVGSLAVMLPDRQAEVAALGLRSLVGGTIATCMSGAVAGVLG